MLCPFCTGTGSHPGQLSTPCKVCKGRAALPDDRISNPPCNFCTGTGQQPGGMFDPCEVCHGWGRLPSDSPPPDSLLFFEAGKPHTAHRHLSDIFGALSGVVRICDPFYGQGSLLRLSLFKGCSKVLFLTHKANKSEESYLSKALTEFVREHSNVEFRRAVDAEVHDRFVLSNDSLFLLGHGLKDPGNKESFVVSIPRSVAGHIASVVEESFDKKWAIAEKLA